MEAVMRAPFLVALIVFTVAVCAFADTVYLKDGRKLEGEIVSEGEETIKLKMKYGSITIDRGDIERIEKGQQTDKKETETQPERGEEPGTAEEKSQAKKENRVTRPKVTLDPVKLDKKVRKLVSKLGTGWPGILAERELVHMGEQVVATLVGIMREKIYWDAHKRAIAKVLGKIGSVNALEPLMRELKECRRRQTELRNACVDALGEIGDERAVDLLIEVVGGKDKRSRCHAAEALGKIGDKRAVESLLKLLKDKSTDNRCYAAAALGELGEKSALPKLQKMWKDDKEKEGEKNEKEPRVLQGVAFALVKLHNSKEAFEYLLKGLMGGWKYGENYLSVKFLGKLGTKDVIKPLVNNTGRIGQRLRMLVREALTKIGSPAVKPLLECMKGGYNPSRWEDATLILGEIGDRNAVKPLIEVLKRGDVKARAYAAQGLGLIGDSRAVAPLIKALEEKDNMLVQYAAVALGRIGDEKAVNPLIKLLGSKNKYIRNMATTSLGQIGPQAVEPLIAALKGATPEIKKGVAEALGKTMDDKAVEALGKLLADETQEVRLESAGALSQIGSDRAVAALGAALKHEDVKTRRTVARAFSKSLNPKAVDVLKGALRDPDWKTRQEAVEALRELGFESAVELLARLFSDKNRMVRWHATRALAYIGGDKALEILIVASENDDDNIHKPAIEGLGRIGGKKAAEKLIVLFRASPTFSYVMNALSAAGDPAVELLIGELNNADAQVRSMAAYTLGGIDNDRVIIPLIRTAVLDQNEKVRDQAGRALSLKGHTTPIEPLIEALKDEDERIRDLAAKMLKGLTRQDFGADYDKWKAWWNKEGGYPLR
jgi:HEAT repeat protein